MICARKLYQGKKCAIHCESLALFHRSSLCCATKYKPGNGNNLKQSWVFIQKSIHWATVITLFCICIEQKYILQFYHLLNLFHISKKWCCNFHGPTTEWKPHSIHSLYHLNVSVRFLYTESEHAHTNNVVYIDLMVIRVTLI